MKKAINFTILLLTVFLVFQLVVVLFKKEHHLNYELVKDEQKYKVDEKYYKTSKNSIYELAITNSDNNTFLFNTDTNYNKQTKIINEIYPYIDNDISCLAVLYQKEEKIETEPKCFYNNIQYSYTQLKKIKPEVSVFVENLDKNNLISHNFDSSSVTTNAGKATAYLDNLVDKMFVSVWDYRNLTVIGNKRVRNSLLTNKDIYTNSLARRVGKYYIMPNYSDPTESNNLIIVNLETSENHLVTFDRPLNNNSYVLGEYNNELYLFDRSNLIEYAVNPENKTIRVVGNEELSGQYYDGSKFVTRSIYEFKSNDLQFIKFNKEEIGLSAYNYSDIFEDYNSYYLLIDNAIYQVYKNHLDNPILIYQDRGLKEFSFINGYSSFIVGNSVYYYNEKTGLKKVITYDELNYNWRNIYHLFAL